MTQSIFFALISSIICLKPGAQVDAGISVIGILFYDYEFRMLAHIVPDDFLLARNGDLLSALSPSSRERRYILLHSDSVGIFITSNIIVLKSSGSVDDVDFCFSPS